MNCKDVQSLEIFSFRNINFFKRLVTNKKTAFVTTKIEVNKPNLRRICLHMVPDYEMHGRI